MYKATCELHCDHSTARRLLRLSAAIVVVLCIVWLYRPAIGAHLPYFYNEDEAHHFNRTVRMVQRGEFNPHYFHKPSLHFYLRMPVVGLSFLWSVRKQYMQSIQEIKTRDEFGIADYSFSASHPGIVKANRLFSILCIAIAAALAVYAVRSLSTRCLSGIALIATLVSPAMLLYGPVIGVDAPMTLFCVAATAAALAYYRLPSYSTLVACCALAGFAVSTKYNAAPIFMLPLFTLWLRRTMTPQNIFWALALPPLFFITASPFILLEFPTFLDHLGYEIWHYGVAGHEGHTADPGLAQLLHYTKWFATSAFGVVGLLLAIYGAVVSWRKDQARTALILFFPVLYTGLMVGQRVNFERNMIVLVPYLAILCTLGILSVAERLRGAQRWIGAALAVGALAQPLGVSLMERHSILHTAESRVELEDWLRRGRSDDERVALAGELQCSYTCYSQDAVRVISVKDRIEELAHTFRYIVMPLSRNLSATEASLVRRIMVLEGVREKQRIVENPAIAIYEVIKPK